MKKKLFAFCAALVLCTGLLAGCGGAGSASATPYNSEHLRALLEKAFTLPMEGLKEVSAWPSGAGILLTNAEIDATSAQVKRDTQAFLEEQLGPFGEGGMNSFYARFMTTDGFGTIFDYCPYNTVVTGIELEQPLENDPSTYYFTLSLNVLKGSEVVEEVSFNGRARVSEEGLVEYFEFRDETLAPFLSRYRDLME